MAVELLALYGEDGQEIGSIWSKLRKGIGKVARFTPQYQLAHRASRLLKKRRHKVHGDDAMYFEGDETVYVYGEEQDLGAFLPGLKKIGKFTHGITTGLARAVGVPQSVLNALAKADITKKGSKAGKAIAAFIPSAGPMKEVVAVPASASKMDMKKILIIGGAGVGTLVVLKLLLTPRRAA